MLEDALEVATDPDYRFDLAVQLGRLEIAKAIAMEVQSESKWKQLGELAISCTNGKVLSSKALCMKGQAMEEIGVDEGQEEAVEVDVDYSTDSAVFVNGNEGEEQWGMNNEGTPSA
ncbi:hypothetical protein GW17_00025430 [Ensete ventricosum]|nr:hypothetical protein GW17_00025430 [Ensete ventricosum]